MTEVYCYVGQWNRSIFLIYLVIRFFHGTSFMFDYNNYCCTQISYVQKNAILSKSKLILILSIYHEHSVS